jgi:hypothetical protein
MVRKFSELLFIGLIIANLSGCASVPGSSGAKLKEPKLIWNVSYLRGLVLTKEALKHEPIQFGNAFINKDTAQLKGNYPDGRTVQIIISKLKTSESSLVVRVDNSQAAKEDAQRLLEAIAQYTKQPK